jgi:hypothetical protein
VERHPHPDAWAELLNRDQPTPTGGQLGAQSGLASEAFELAGPSRADPVIAPRVLLKKDLISSGWFA